ncbi:MAG TPA: hypothetical protein VFX96_06395, partial [Pyrinomonadaceae bacterium]|nr:hypothetical protein [Pyrinomonadaceae bacterium]
MTRLARLSLPCLLAASLTGALPAAAQNQPAKSSAKRPAKTTAAADPLEEARRMTAVALVNSLADEARNFGDHVLRARVQARAADALWETDRERALALFRRAWDAAETADREQGARRAQQAASRGAASSRDAGSIRREVLRLAARRDGALGTEFLSFLEDAKKREAADAASATDVAATSNQPPPQSFNPDDPPTAMTQRLNLATQLLEDGEVERAMQFADPALYPVNTFGANFLDMLRERDAKAADERYMALLARAASDPSADANTVSLLSTYVFTPFLYIIVNREGNSHTRRWRGDNSPPSTLSPAVRDAFLRTAASILTRTLPPPDQDRSTSGRMGTYVMLTRLAPLFERFMPDRAADLRARASALLQDTNEETRRADNPLFTRGLTPEPSREEQLAQLLSRIDTAKTADERDRLYFRAATGFIETDAVRAREYANKIEDADLRAQLLAFVDFQSVRVAIEAKKPEEALRFARTGQLTNVQRAWSLTEVAKLLAKTESGRAIELLDEAVAEARKIDAASPDRPRALVAVATQLYGLDRPRAWELMSEIVKAANAVPDFSGEDGGLNVRVQLRGGGAMSTSFNIESFNLAGVFASLAKEDLNRAVELARGLTGEHTRSMAMLAVVRTVLNKNSE